MIFRFFDLVVRQGSFVFEETETLEKQLLWKKNKNVLLWMLDVPFWTREISLVYD